MVHVRGTPIQGGLSIGPIHFLRRTDWNAPERSSNIPGEERRRFEAARGRAIVELRRIRARVAAHLGDSEAMIFLVQSMMLEDEDYLKSIYSYIDSAATAEYAVSQVGRELVALFASLDSSYMRARAADARDLSRRMEGILAGHNDWLHLRQNAAILMAEEVVPSDTTLLDRGKLLGLVSRHGSPESHAAILAHAMGSPSLTDVEIDPAWDGHIAVLDGDNGTLTIDPDGDFLQSVQPRVRLVLDHMARQAPQLPCRTRNGRTITLSASAGSAWEAADAHAAGADGIGLLHTDALYADRTFPPDEAEQMAEYRETLLAMRGQPVTFQAPDHMSGAFTLGQRFRPGIHEVYGLYKTQFRAVLRVADIGPASLLLPENLRSMRRGRMLMEQCRRELEHEGVPCGPVPLGVLVRSPSSILRIDALAAEADFLILDGHDLFYSTVTGDADNPDYPTILWMVRRAAMAGKRLGRRVAVSGDLSKYPQTIQALLDVGVDEFVVPVSALPRMRSFIREQETPVSTLDLMPDMVLRR